MIRLAHALCGASLIVLMSVTTGCSTQVSIPAWQQSVSHYVQAKGGGDPTVLRDMKLPVDGRPGYAIIGHHDVEESTDAKALLLGNEQLGGRVWLVYLVGLVKKQQVVDIQLAALTVEGGKTIWKRGKSSKQAFDAYRDDGLKQAHERFPDRKSPPARYTQFPKPDDVFELTSHDDKFVATHVATGAQWELLVSAAKK